MAYTDPGFRPFECTSAEGLTIRGSLHHLPGTPLVLFFHGFTGHRMGPGYLFVKLSRALADAGFSSLRFDFTGSGESEGAFSNMNTATMMQDVSSVISAVRETVGEQPLVFCGHSFGGMIAARCAGIYDVPGLILIAPVGNPTGLIRRRKALLDAGPNPSGYYENGPHEMSISFLDSLKGFDPVTECMAHFRGSLLLFQGDRDPSIAIDESRRYVDAAREASLPVGYHLIEGSDHNFSRVSDVATVITTVTTWIKELFGV